MVERILNNFEQYPLDFISDLGSVLPIAIGFIQFKKLNRNGKLIWGLFIFYFLRDIFALIYSLVVPNNLFVHNIDQIVTTLLVGLIYYYSFEKPFQKRLLLVSTIVCGLITIFAYDSSTVSEVSFSVSRLFSIALTLLYFNKIIRDMQVKIITRHGLFWFTSALLLFSAGTFFITLFGKYWNNENVSSDTFDFYWNVTQIMFIVFCCLSAYGLWVSKYEQEI